jgi:bla regulator protein blaR1
MLRSIASLLGISMLIAGAAFGQTPGQTPQKPVEFEVASIKPTEPGAQGSSLLTDRSAGLTVKNMPVKALIGFAYDVKDFQISGGPGWVNTDRYDVTAKISHSGISEGPPDPRAMTDDQRKLRDNQLRERVRTMLADRFGLVIHKEMKDAPAYALVVAKNGPKLTAVAVPGEQQGVRGNGRGHLQGMAAPTPMLASVLSNNLGRPVLDKTGLTEKYDWVLEWTPDGAIPRPDGTGPDSPQPAEGTGPSIFTAVQEQLGLRLDSIKAPVETVVIDHVDRPSEN